MLKTTLALALKIDRALARDYAEYLEACESWRKDGYRPAHCEHGTNLWTEYDNICGWCEDGRTMGDPLQRRESALNSARYREERVREILTAASTLNKLVPRWDYPSEVWDEVKRLLTVE